MVHRGPDDEGYEQLPVGDDGEGVRTGFGFRRLAILDRSPAGHQPIVNPATGDVLVFNGEIYNFRTLRHRLASAGWAFRGSGDTEVLLAALSTWGQEAFDEIDGMFALAFYHASTRRVLLARDHLGIKPLYVGRAPGAFVFASEVRAVLASGLVSNDLSAAGIATFFAYGAPQDPLTIHRDVESFPAGSYAWLDADVVDPAVPIRRRRYWCFPRTVAPHTEADVVEAIRFKLTAAVRDQLVADVPVGLFLSGGIDSAILAAFASHEVTDVRTHAVGFESQRIVDELRDAAETAAFLGTTHSETIVTDRTVEGLWHQWLDSLDRPSIDGFNTFIVSRAVRDAGMTVALSGLGADELFGGYPRQFRAVPRMTRMLAPLAIMPRAMRAAAARVAFAPLRGFRRSRAIDLVTNARSVLDVLLRIRRICTDEELASLGLVADQLGLCGQFLPPAEYAAIAGSGKDDVFNTIAHAECSLYMGNTTLRDSDTNGMAHSIEIRVPYLARSFVDYVGGVPGAMQMPKGAPAKHLLRRAGGRVLPESLYRRPKTGFSLPIGEWMFGNLRESCESAVETVARCPLLDGAGVRAMWGDFTADERLTDLWFRPLAIVALGKYLERLRSPVPTASAYAG